MILMIKIENAVDKITVENVMNVIKQKNDDITFGELLIESYEYDTQKITIKVLSIILSMVMALSPMAVLAEEPVNSSDILLTTKEQVFSATVPTGLPITLLGTGEVLVANDAKIVNNSKGPMKVVSIEGESVTPWRLEDFSADFTVKKVGTKELGLQFNEDNMSANGDVSLTEAAWPSIDGMGNLELAYQGKLPAQSEAIADLVAANVAFVLDWDK